MEELKSETVENTQKIGKHAKEKQEHKQKNKTNLTEKREVQENIKKENKKLEKFLITIIIFLSLFTLVLDIYYIYTKLTPKFKDTTIEIGYEEELNIRNFMTKEKYLEDSKVITDLTKIDLNKVRRI